MGTQWWGDRRGPLRTGGSRRRGAALACAAGALVATTAAGIAAAAPGDTIAVKVKEIDPDPAVGSFPEDLTAIGGTIFMEADDGSPLDQELYRSDGTAAGTVLVKDIQTAAGLGSSPEDLVNVGGTLLFRADDGSAADRELWKSDGTATGTVMVEDINQGTTFGGNSVVAVPTVANGTLLFRAESADGMGVSIGQELWKSAPPFDAASTELVEEIRPGTAGGIIQPIVGDGGVAIFGADNGTTGFEPWKTAPPYNAGTTSLIEDVNLTAGGGGTVDSFPEMLANVDGTIFFAAGTGADPFDDRELWKLEPPDYDDAILVEDINASGPAASSEPFGGINVNGTLFFAADDGTGGVELWKSEPPNFDAASTSRVRDINPGPGSSIQAPDGAAFNGMLFFTADDGSNGFELWRSDGSEAGTTMVANINTGDPAGSSPGFSSDPGHHTASGGTLYFTALDPQTGTELWRTDGTTVTRVSDINPGAGDSLGGELVDLNGTLIFRASDSGVNIELWRTALEQGPMESGPATEDGRCAKLRKKLKRQKRTAKRAQTDRKRAQVQANIAKTRNRLRELGCA